MAKIDQHRELINTARCYQNIGKLLGERLIQVRDPHPHISSCDQGNIRILTREQHHRSLGATLPKPGQLLGNIGLEHNILIRKIESLAQQIGVLHVPTHHERDLHTTSLQSSQSS